jgi:hypothetical protein
MRAHISLSNHISHTQNDRKLINERMIAWKVLTVLPRSIFLKTWTDLTPQAFKAGCYTHSVKKFSWKWFPFSPFYMATTAAETWTEGRRKQQNSLMLLQQTACDLCPKMYKQGKQMLYFECCNARLLSYLSDGWLSYITDKPSDDTGVWIPTTAQDGGGLNLLTPCSRGLLEKPTGSQLVKKCPAFYGTQRLTTAFTRARHLSLRFKFTFT